MGKGLHSLKQEAGLFYKHLASEQGPLVPVVMYAEGNMTTGAKCIIMEDLGQWIDSGRLLGPTNPHNWGRDLAADVKEAGGPSERQVALATFLACAKLHARYWRDEKLLSVPWLAHAEWVRGENRAAWEASLEFTRAQWSKGKGSVVGWFDATVFDAVEKAVECTSWESQRTRLNEKTHWTLVHGDCWAGNVMWHKNGRVKLVDWEMAGVGSGPQDIGQYVISGVHPDVRRLHEHGLVHDYYDELIRCGLTGFTFEECWREYTLGGVEKWLFFLCYLAGEDLPDWTRAFHDQVLCFMKDHGITAADIRQFRP